jgi:hypothetical protein
VVLPVSIPVESLSILDRPSSILHPSDALLLPLAFVPFAIFCGHEFIAPFSFLFVSIRGCY